MRTLSSETAPRGGVVDRLPAFVAAHPETAFVWFLALHCAVWTLLPALVWRNPPLDIIEALAYGPEWQLGSWKHPPLPWWIVEGITSLVGGVWAAYLAAQIAIAVCFWSVWRLGRTLYGPLAALAGVAVLEGIHYYTFTSPKFNHDVIQLPFWALTGLSLWHALATGKTKHWLLVGLWLGCAWWAKYLVLVLTAALALFFLFERDARRHLTTRGPWLAAAVALSVAAPNLAWLATHDFQPYRNVVDNRMPAAAGFIDHFFFPAHFAGSQLLYLAPALLLIALLAWPRGSARSQAKHSGTAPFAQRYLFVLTFGPLALMLAASAVLGRKLVPLWGYPLWNFLGLYAVAVLQPSFDRARLRRLVAATIFVMSASALAFAVSYRLLPHFDGRYRATNFNGAAAGQRVTELWQRATGRPLRYVIGPMWAAGNIAAFSPDRPRVYVDADASHAPWIDPADIRRHGAVIAWITPTGAPPKSLEAWLDGAERQPILELASHHRAEPAMPLHWAILYPRDR
jgi:4-amino-4-deoxy-L-arabinose transferase-like glycosyltransferase